MHIIIVNYDPPFIVAGARSAPEIFQGVKAGTQRKYEGNRGLSSEQKNYDPLKSQELEITPPPLVDFGVFQFLDDLFRTGKTVPKNSITKIQVEFSVFSTFCIFHKK